MKTYVLKEKEITKNWYLIDAKDKILGRFASEVAKILRGKNKPIFSPYIDSGDHVVIINASQIKVTGKKLKNKVYRRYSGYPGGLKEVTLETMLRQKPTQVLMSAIKGMLPKGPLGNKMLKKLRIYAGATHKQEAQKLKPLEVLIERN